MKPLLKFVFFSSVFLSFTLAKKVPDLNIKLIDGSKTTILELAEDGPLLIDFWATWCVPCKKVMKHLNQFHLKYDDQNFKVLMINTDSPRSFGKVKSFIRSQDYKFYVGLDPNQITARKLDGLVMPTLILVDAGGEITWRHQGYSPGDEKEIENQIELLLSKNTK